MVCSRFAGRVDEAGLESRLHRSLNEQVIVTAGQIGMCIEAAEALPGTAAVGHASAHAHIWAACGGLARVLKSHAQGVKGEEVGSAKREANSQGDVATGRVVFTGIPGQGQRHVRRPMGLRCAIRIGQHQKFMTRGPNAS